jgi:hypothetical protein
VCFFEFTSDRWNRRLVPHRVVVAALLVRATITTLVKVELFGKSKIRHKLKL